MGCDIHGALEINKAGKWQFLEKVRLSRNYNAFSVLFSVRDYTGLPTLFAERGLPKDANDKTLFRHMKKLSEEEIDKLYDEHPELCNLPAESVDSHSQTYMLASELTDEVLQKEVHFTHIYKVGWKEEAKKNYAQWEKDIWASYKKAQEQEPNRQRKSPDDLIGTEEDWIAGTEPLAIATDHSEIIIRFGGANIQSELILSALKEGKYTKTQKMTMRDVIAYARKHPELYEVVEIRCKTQDLYKWAKPKDWNDFIFKRLPELAKQYGAENVRWVAWFDN